MCYIVTMKRLWILMVLLMGGLGIMRGEVELYPLEYKIVDSLGNSHKWGEYTVNLRVVEQTFVVYFLNEKREVVEPPVEYAIVRYEGPNFVRLTGNKARRLKSDPLALGPYTGAIIRKREGDIVKLDLGPGGSALVSEKYILNREVYWAFLFLYKTDKKTGKEVIVGEFPRERLLKSPQTLPDDIREDKGPPIFKSSYEKALYEREHQGSY